MPVITDEQRTLIGKETEPRHAPYPVNIAMAKHWSEMVEDPNPIYFDEEYARSTWLEGTFAPPAMLYTWGRPLIWPEEKSDTPLSQLGLGYPITIAVKAVQEYFVPVRYGDEVSVTSKLADVSDEKTTRLGTGHFVTTVDTFRNQRGDVVGTHAFTFFTYRPHEAEDGA